MACAATPRRDAGSLRMVFLAARRGRPAQARPAAPAACPVRRPAAAWAGLRPGELPAFRAPLPAALAARGRPDAAAPGRPWAAMAVVRPRAARLGAKREAPPAGPQAAPARA